MKSKMLTKNLESAEIIAETEKVSVKKTGNIVEPEILINTIEATLARSNDYMITQEVDFDTLVRWTVLSAVVGWSVTLDGIIYSNGTPQYADATQTGKNKIHVVYVKYAIGQEGTIKTSKLLQFSPPLPEHFEIRGTLTVKCTHVSGTSPATGGTDLFFGFSDNGDYWSTDNHVGISVVADNSFASVGAIGFGTNDSEAINYYQPADKIIWFLIRKTSGNNWYVELTDGTTTKSLSDNGTIDPEQFIVFYTEYHVTGTEMVRMESDITIDSVIPL